MRALYLAGSKYRQSSNIYFLDVARASGQNVAPSAVVDAGLDATPNEPRRRERIGSIGEERGMTNARGWSWIALASAALAVALAASTADAQDKTLKIGVLTDMTNVS